MRAGGSVRWCSGVLTLLGRFAFWWQILARTSQAVYTQLQAVRRQVCSAI
jgi:hypothetical protein